MKASSGEYGHGLFLARTFCYYMFNQSETRCQDDFYQEGKAPTAENEGNVSDLSSETGNDNHAGACRYGEGMP